MALHCHYIGDTQYRVWFDLDNSLTRWRRTFLKFLFREIRKIPYENPIFFRGKLYQFYFALHCHYTGDTQYRVWFDLDNTLTRWKTTIFKILKNSQFAKFAKFRKKNIFFLSKLYQQLFCFTLSLHWWYSIPSLIWFGQLLDPVKKIFFFKFSKIRNSRNSQKSVWKLNFFLGTLYQKTFCFTLSLHWWYSIPRLVWFGQLLNPMKKTYFQNSFFAKFAKVPYENPIFFPRPALTIFFLLYTLITLLILNTEFGLIWTTPWPAEKKLYFSKIRNSRNSQNSVWKPNFFLGALYQYFFCLTLSLNWWYSIPRLVWFGQLLNPIEKKPIFKIPFSRNSQNSVRKLNFFPRPALPIFLPYTVITLVILNTEFGLIWTTPWSAEKKLNFSKIRNSRNSQNSVWKPNFFLGALYQYFFCLTLSLNWWYSIPRLVWFGQLLDPLKKNFFFKFSKIRNSRNSQNSVWKLNFSHYTGDTPYRVWFDLDNSLTRWKKPIFKIPFSRNSQKFRTKTQFFSEASSNNFFCFTLSLHCWYSITSLVWFGQLLDPLKKK